MGRVRHHARQGTKSMVATIAGNGLGLDNTSLQKLGVSAGGTARTGQGNTAGYVNLANGNLVLQGSDEGLVFAGTRLSFVRTYNSQGQMAGHDWRYGFSQSIGAVAGTIGTAGSSVVRTASDGSQVTYVYDTERGLYVGTNQSGSEDTLAWDSGSGQWAWTDAQTRQSETYNADGALTALTNPVSGASFTFTYANGLLTQIRAADGDMLTLGYDATGLLTSLSVSAIPAGGGTAVTRQQVAYTYDAQSRLETVSTSLDSDSLASGATYTTRYAYAGTSDRIATATQSDGTTVAYTYAQDANGQWRVASTTTGTGADATTVQFAYADGQTTLTDASGKTWVYTLDAQGNLTSVTAPTVAGTATQSAYAYDANGNLIRATDPNGGVTAYAYDAHGNLVWQQDATGHVVSYTYDAADQLTSTTTWTTAAQGQPGDAGYVAPTGPETTYDIRDAGERIAYIVDATGAVTQNLYAAGLNGATVLASAITYRGVTFDASPYSPSSPPTAQDLADWIASATVQAARSQGVRVDNIYTASGQLLQQTLYDTLDANGAGVMDAGTVIHKTIYDAQGQLRQSIVLRGVDRTVSEQTSYAYDGMGRTLGSVDALGNATAYVYDDAHNAIAVYQANGLVTSTFRNSAGQVVSVVQGPGSLSATQAQTLADVGGTSSGSQLVTDSTLLYDANGRAIVSIDGQGNAAYTFYDGQGRIAGTVNAAGQVTTFVYDAQGNLTTQTTFATTVSTVGWLNDRSLGSAYPGSLPTVSSGTGDQVTRWVFDTSNHAVASVAPDGTVTLNGFDGNGNKVYSTLYGTKLTAAQMASLGNTPTLAQVQAEVSASSTDATTLWVFDGGSLAAIVDPAGTVTQYTRDAAGNVIQQRIYFTALTGSQRSSLGNTPTWSAVQADLSMNAKDRLSLTLYDANERVAATVDAGGNVVFFHYNASGKLASQTVVANSLTASQFASLVGSPSLSTLQSDVSLGDSGTNYLKVFNDGNLYATVSADGHVTTYSYDYQNFLTSINVRGTQLTAAQVTSLGTAPSPQAVRDLLKTSPQDQITLYVRDSSSQVIATVTPVAQYTTVNGVTTLSYGGQITTTTYNANGQVAVQTVFNTTLTAAKVLALWNTPTQAKVNASVTRSAYDQTHFWLYDDHDRLAASGTPVNGNDGNGTTFTTYSYDTANHPLATVTHTKPLTQAQATAVAGTPTLAKLKGYLATTTSDYGSILIYDTNYNVVATVSGSNATSEAVSQITYDAQGWPYQVKHLGTMLSAAQFAALAATPTPAKLSSTLPPKGSVVAGDAYDYTIYAANGKPAITLVAQLSGGAWQGLLTTYQYDGSGRVTAMTTYAPVSGQPLATFNAAPGADTLQDLVDQATSNGTSLTVFDDAGNTIATVSPSGAVQTWSFDGANRQQVARTYSQPLTASAMASLGDAPTLAQIIAALPAGDPSTSVIDLHDEAGHLVAHVDSAGIVTLNVLDSHGFLASTTVYATALTAAQQAGLGDQPTVASVRAAVSSAAGDATQYQVHDAAGHLLATVDAGGHVAMMGVDASGHTVSTVQYATALTTAQLASFAQNPTLATLQGMVTSDPVDQIAISAFDASGFLLATASNGAVSLYTNDASGHAINTVTVTNPLSMQQMRELASGPSLDGILGDLALNQGNRGSQTVYDGSGNAVATVGTDGHVTIMAYDSDGHEVSAIDYGYPLPSGHGYYGSLAALTSEITNPAGFTSLTLFNAQGQVLATVDQDGKTSVNRYDVDGHLTGTGHYDTNMTASQRAQMAAAPSMASLQAIYAPTGTGGGTSPGNGGNPGGGVGPSPGGGTGIAPGTGRMTHVLYDAAGRPAATIDPAGGVTYTFYDADGHVSATVDGDGDVTGYTRDADGQVVATTAYANQVDTSGWMQSGALSAAFPASFAPTTSAQDRTSLSVYDAAGRVVATIDGAGRRHPRVRRRRQRRQPDELGHAPDGRPTPVPRHATHRGRALGPAGGQCAGSHHAQRIRCRSSPDGHGRRGGLCYYLRPRHPG